MWLYLLGFIEKGLVMIVCGSCKIYFINDFVTLFIRVSLNIFFRLSRLVDYLILFVVTYCVKFSLCS